MGKGWIEAAIAASGRHALLLATLVLAVSLSLPAFAAPRHASIVIDAATGRVLEAANADARTYPASLTKMMTLYLLFERLSKGSVTLTQVLTVSEEAASRPATNLNLDPGDKITVDTAIRAIIVRSANDVATVVGEALGGTESQFARLMTQKAKALGMRHTVFRNASGLPDEDQVTTARDLAFLSQALVRDFPQYYAYFAMTRFSYKGHTYYGHNRLMSRYDGADGLKTGYIRASGYNLATSAVRDGQRLIGIVLGGKSPPARDAEMAKLLDRGFGARSKGAKPVLVAKADAPKAKPSKLAGGWLAIPLPKPAVSLTQTQIAAVVTPRKARAVALPILEKPDFDAVALASPKPAAPAPAPIQVAAAETVADDGGLLLISTAAAAEIAPSHDRTIDSMWKVQVGAFSTSDSAGAVASTVSDMAPKLLADAEIKIEAAEKKGHKIYRAQFVGLTEKTAKAVCQGLKAKDKPCMVMAPKVTVAELSN
jgi:D-alanyl-D-alanine carboxypeptidase